MDRTIHSESSHNEKLNLLCRICGRRSFKTKEPRRNAKTCDQYAKKIESVYGLDVKTDTEGVHSKCMCHRCYARMNAVFSSLNPSEKTLESAKKDVMDSNHIWLKFDQSVSVEDCSVCRTYTQFATGGRPLKLKGRAVDSELPDSAHHHSDNETNTDLPLYSTPIQNIHSANDCRQLRVTDLFCGHQMWHFLLTTSQLR